FIPLFCEPESIAPLFSQKRLHKSSTFGLVCTVTAQGKVSYLKYVALVKLRMLCYNSGSLI
ncbi:MAG: hypothetical protein FWC20_09825, partial [Oscillospiraceae bacterium]|nr:hypothetical protein [Oscillospiraceae bacterium]